MQDTSVRRRRHSAVLKAEIPNACAQPGVSVAGIALSYGVNANLVHRWRRDAKRPLDLQLPRSETAQFVLPAVAGAPAVGSGPEIRIELRRGTCTVTVAWPTSAAVDCAVWLRDLVR